MKDRFARLVAWWLEGYAYCHTEFDARLDAIDEPIDGQPACWAEAEPASLGRRAPRSVITCCRRRVSFEER
jgi:hypothetical protein